MDPVTRIFIILGGDPASLDLTEYQRYGANRGIQKLTNRTNWTVGAFAIVASAIPVLHVGAVILEIAYLMRRMSQVAWSIGVLKGAQIDQDDLIHILAIWSGSAGIRDINMHEVVSAKMSMKAGGKFLAKIPGKLTGKIASKLALKLAVKTGGKLLTGFISILGGGISAWISVYFLNSIAVAAEEYYSALLTAQEEMD